MEVHAKKQFSPFFFFFAQYCKCAFEEKVAGTQAFFSLFKCRDANMEICVSPNALLMPITLRAV